MFFLFFIVCVVILVFVDNIKDKVESYVFYDLDFMFEVFCDGDYWLKLGVSI